MNCKKVETQNLGTNFVHVLCLLFSLAHHGSYVFNKIQTQFGAAQRTNIPKPNTLHLQSVLSIMQCDLLCQVSSFQLGFKVVATKKIRSLFVKSNSNCQPIYQQNLTSSDQRFLQYKNGYRRHDWGHWSDSMQQQVSISYKAHLFMFT